MHNELKVPFYDHNSLVNMGKTDFGEGNAYLSMYNECFSKKAGKHKYNICPFKRADQDGTALGHFDSLYSKGGSGKANMIYKMVDVVLVVNNVN